MESTYRRSSAVYFPGTHHAASVPAENSRNLAAKIPGAKLVIIEGAGHAVFVERAGAFNDAATEFPEAMERD